MTMAVGIFERLTKYRLTKRAYVAVFVFTFLFVAFFLAWHDQLNTNRSRESKINQIDEELGKLKQQVADQTIVQVTTTKLSADTVKPFHAGTPISVNLGYANTGMIRAHNMHIHHRVGFVSATDQELFEQSIDRLFSSVYDEIANFTKENRKGMVVDPGTPQGTVCFIGS